MKNMTVMITSHGRQQKESWFQSISQVMEHHSSLLLLSRDTKDVIQRLFGKSQWTRTFFFTLWFSCTERITRFPIQKYCTDKGCQTKRQVTLFKGMKKMKKDGKRGIRLLPISFFSLCNKFQLVFRSKKRETDTFIPETGGHLYCNPFATCGCSSKSRRFDQKDALRISRL